MKQYWFIYGELDTEITLKSKNEKKIYKGKNEVFKYAMSKMNSNFYYLNLCNTFEKHINDTNSDIEVEGVGNGSFIEGVKGRIARLNLVDITYLCDSQMEIYI
jgi:hypothetical protein